MSEKEEARPIKISDVVEGPAPGLDAPARRPQVAMGPGRPVEKEEEERR